MTTYAIQKNFYIEEKKVWSDFYQVGQKDTHFSITVEFHFDALLQDGDYRSIAMSTSLLNDVSEEIITYIKAHESVIQEQLKQIHSNDEEFSSLSNSNTEKNIVSLRFIFKKPNATIEELIETVQQTFSKYAVKLLKQVKEKKLHPDLTTRLKNYVSEHSAIKANEQVLDIITTIENIERHEKHDPIYGTDYDFYVTAKDGIYEFSFPKSYEPSCNEPKGVPSLSDGELEQIYNIFYDAYLFWD